MTYTVDRHFKRRIMPLKRQIEPRKRSQSLGQAEHHTSPTERLWQAVLSANIAWATDYYGYGCLSTFVNDVERHVCRLWIGSRDFKIVCIMAGFDPDYVEEKTKRRLEFIEHEKEKAQREWIC